MVNIKSIRNGNAAFFLALAITISSFEWGLCEEDEDIKLDSSEQDFVTSVGLETVHLPEDNLNVSSAITTLVHEIENNLNSSTQLPIEKLFPSLANNSSPSQAPAENISTTKSIMTTTERYLPVSCRCGVFLTSQLKRGASNRRQPKDDPVVVIDVDTKFPCTQSGQRQCQTKCLQTIVTHLPNSADILCASLDRDIRKERAHLFVQNCDKPWFNTNLAAGREYCCRNGTSYPCPIV